MENIQIAKEIFLILLSIMKSLLDLLAFKFGKNTEDYRYLKKVIMNLFYNKLKNLFKNLKDRGILIRCECKSNLRNGYSDCKFCSGSGYKNKLN